MSEHPIDLHCSGEQMPDGTWTITLMITGCKDVHEANRIAAWMRAAMRQNVQQIGRLETPVRQ